MLLRPGLRPFAQPQDMHADVLAAKQSSCKTFASIVVFLSSVFGRFDLAALCVCVQPHLKSVQLFVFLNTSHVCH